MIRSRRAKSAKRRTDVHGHTGRRKLFRKLTVNGVDCLAQPTTGDVTAVKNGASYTITIKDVISNIAVDVEAVEYQIAANTLDTVPSALSGKFSTIDELKRT